ncbi:RNA-binding S4 domain-containing protein [Trueperella sp. LYQ143]|uniref:RNA-binding S4 domain-containing protein n=1 Tax=unclassified Trueperella TaxID=2630174 RepID=UPI003983B170
MEQIDVRVPITLGQFLKVANLADTGGQARLIIAEGLVRVNGEVEMHRSHNLADGDIVSVDRLTLQVRACN